MNSVAIVAIVAMFLFAVLHHSNPRRNDWSIETGPTEVILTIDPPPVGGIFFPPLPERNPNR